MKRDLTSILDVSRKEIYELFALTKKLKSAWKRGVNTRILPDKTLAMVFEKPSLRTRVTFETGMTQLGGHAVYLAPADIQLGKRESTGDIAKNLSRWVDIIMARVFSNDTIREIARSASVPVINGLCDREHPCQILCDLFTILEKKRTVEKITIAYIGDGNNVCNSFIAASYRLGFRLNIATPPGYEPDRRYVAPAKNVRLTNSPSEAVRDADVIYTDVWASMGQEAEQEKRKKIFKEYQINRRLLKHARKKYLIMHCLPAHRGEEITGDVIDGPASIVFDQAENRLHIQKAILVFLLNRS